MKHQFTYTKPTNEEQMLINSVSRMYHVRGCSNINRCKLNELNYSRDESDVHLKRKLVLCLVFRFFFTEAQRYNQEFDFKLEYKYRGPSKIRDVVDVSRFGLIHEIESNSEKENIKRFLYPGRWVAGNGRHTKNTTHIRDPDLDKLYVHSFEDGKWKLFVVLNRNKSKKYYSDADLYFKEVKKYSGLKYSDFESIAKRNLKQEFNDEKLNKLALELK